LILRPAVSDRIDVPTEPCAWVQVRRLNRPQLAACALERMRRGITNTRDMVNSPQFRAIQDQFSGASEKTEAFEESERDLLSRYDIDTLLRGGVAAWSYPFPVTSIECLKPATAEWMARKIATFSEGR
jgi:hypothetical protein